MVECELMIRLSFVVTAGGTREPIDDVRYIGNRSTGRLGAEIARVAISRGHHVLFVHGIESVTPDGFDDRCSVERGVYRRLTFGSARDLLEILEREIPAMPHPGAVAMAAAVADYTPVRQPGKISSAGDELILRLRKVEKLVDRVKTWNPELFLVKFKLESGCSRHELVAIGKQSARQSRADLMLLNDVSALTTERHPAILYWPKGGGSLVLEDKKAIARAIVRAVEEWARKK